jgi:four helix bundle protein
MKDEKEAKTEASKSLPDRGREFALRIVGLYAALSERTLEQCLGKQLLRSGTSVGAHLSEGKRSRSRAEIISKTEVALQELEESAYWMKLLRDSGVVQPSRLEGLMREADELTAILVAGINRLKAARITH